jgi:hypothetical protein
MVTGFGIFFCLAAAEGIIGFAGAIILRVDTVTFDFLAPSETRGQFFRDRACPWRRVFALVCFGCN